jgi:hypothetical protein
MKPSVLAGSYAVSRAIHWYVDSLPMELGIYLRHSYTYRDPCKGPVIWMDFTSQDLLDVNEARRVMVETVEGFLGRLNNDPEIAIAFNNVPFTFENLYVSIEYESYFGQYVDPLYVARTELKDSWFTASYAHTAFNERAPIFHMHKEPYESSRFFIMVQDDIEDAHRMREEEEKANRSDFFNLSGPPIDTRMSTTNTTTTGATLTPPPETVYPTAPTTPLPARRPVTTTTPTTTTTPNTGEPFIKHPEIKHPTLDSAKKQTPSYTKSRVTPPTVTPPSINSSTVQ